MRLGRAILYWLLLLPLAGFVARPAAASGLAFVMNSDSASISVIDMSTLKELRRIPVLRQPHHVALSPDGKSILVGDTVGNQMLFIDPKTGVVQKRMPCVDPYQLGFSPNGRFLVVNGLARNQVDVYDAATMKLIRRFPAQDHAEPSGVFAGFRAGVRDAAGHRPADGDRSAAHEGAVVQACRQHAGGRAVA